MQSGRRIAKCRFDQLIKFSLSEPSDRDLQTFTSLLKRIAKELAFRRVDQRVRRENVRKRG